VVPGRCPINATSTDIKRSRKKDQYQFSSPMMSKVKGEEERRNPELRNVCCSQETTVPER
jgi:hypothetical protein